MPRRIIGRGFRVEKDETYAFGSDFYTQPSGSIERRVSAVETHLESQSSASVSDEPVLRDTAPIDIYLGLDREESRVTRQGPAYRYDKEYAGPFTDRLNLAIESFNKVAKTEEFQTADFPTGTTKEDLRQLQVMRQIYMDIVDRAVQAAVSLSNRERYLQDQLLGM